METQEESNEPQDNKEQNEQNENKGNANEEPQQKVIPKKFNQFLLYVLIWLMILTGSANSIINKILQKLYSLDIQFEQHHWIITFGMFLGELVSIFIYIAKVNGLIKPNKEDKGSEEPERKGEEAEEQSGKKDEKGENLISDQEEKNEEETAIVDASGSKENAEIKEEEEKKKPPVPTNLIFALSASCDLMASTINTFGLTYLTTSIYQMMRGMELFFVCLWSKVILRNKIYRHNYLGIGTLLFGLSLVGINSIIHKKEDQGTARDPLKGIILMCISQLFSSSCYIIQERFVKKYHILSIQIVGFEGLWGSIMYTILLIVLQNVRCEGWDIKDELCFKNDKGEYRMEDTIFGFRQLGANFALLILYISYIVSIALYNIVGINLTQLVSSTARAVVDTVRTVFIWAFFLFCSPVEGTQEHFYIVQFIGFIFLVLGTIIYNEILVIPFFKLDYYTRENIRERAIQEAKLMKVAKDPNDTSDKLYDSINRDSDRSGIGSKIIDVENKEKAANDTTLD